MTNIKNNIIKINIAIFLFTRIGNDFWVKYFALTPELLVKKLFIWQVFTHAFMHANLLHLALNMIMLHILGKDLLPILGKKLFLRYYIISALGSGIVILFASQFSKTMYYTPTLGASGAVFSLFLAYGLTFKERIMYIWGVYPIKAFKLIIILIVIELISLPSSSGISHIGHLGGVLTGFLYIKYLKIKKEREQRRYQNNWKN